MSPSTSIEQTPDNVKRLQEGFVLVPVAGTVVAAALAVSIRVDPGEFLEQISYDQNSGNDHSNKYQLAGLALEHLFVNGGLQARVARRCGPGKLYCGR